MGFGLLVIGYATMMVWGLEIDPDLMIGFDILPDILGYILFFKGLSNLRPYSKGFVLARYITFPLMILGGVTFAAQATALLGTWIPEIAVHWSLLQNIDSIVRTVSVPLLFFFHLYLCQGIRELAAEVELNKVVSLSKIAVCLSSVFYLGQLIAGVAPLPGAVVWVITLLHYIVYFYYLYLLYSCYMHIVYADETPKEVFNPLMRLLDKIKKNDSSSK
ncbi:MAG: hypothetical protein IJX47_05285 [Clostridia bacterium]|nr:hypothetical protein [Clostridia bacterium]